MAKTIVGLFDRAEDARNAVNDLVNSGFPREDISLVANNVRGEHRADSDADMVAEGAGAGALGGAVVGGLTGLLIGLGALTLPGIGPVVTAGTLATTLGWTAAGAGIGAATGGLIGGLVGAGIPDEDANVYAEGIRRGGTLVMVTTTDEQADEAAAIMQRYNVVDIDERSAEYRRGGWTSFEESAGPYTREQLGSRTSATSSSGTSETGGAMRKEDQQAGMGEARRGGVRIHNNLSGRMSDASRRPPDYMAGAMPGASDELVVLEEVVLDSDLEGQERAVGMTGFDRYDADFRNDFNHNYASGGGAYENYMPVYRYGYRLGSDQRYHNRQWADIEPEARRRWEERNPGTWDRFRSSMQYAWDRARSAI